MGIPIKLRKEASLPQVYLLRYTALAFAIYFYRAEAQYNEKGGIMAEEAKALAGKKNNIILEERKKLSISGVTDVESFDDGRIMAFTTLGELEIKGSKLHVSEMSLESGEAVITGEIKSIVYGDKDRTRRLTLWGKLTR